MLMVGVGVMLACMRYRLVMVRVSVTEAAESPADLELSAFAPTPHSSTIACQHPEHHVRFLQPCLLTEASHCESPRTLALTDHGYVRSQVEVGGWTVVRDPAPLRNLVVLPGDRPVLPWVR